MIKRYWARMSTLFESKPQGLETIELIRKSDIADSLVKWHDLPDDLPPEDLEALVRGWSISVWLLDNKKKYHYGCFALPYNGQWEPDCDYSNYENITDVKIIAWAYPKPPLTPIKRNKMEMQKIIHILRNPYRWNQAERDDARLAAADEIEKWKNAFENLRQYAEDNGLDIMTYNNHREQSHG